MSKTESTSIDWINFASLISWNRIQTRGELGNVCLAKINFRKTERESTVSSVYFVMQYVTKGLVFSIFFCLHCFLNP